MTSKEYINGVIWSAYSILEGRIDSRTSCEIISAFTLIRRMDCILTNHYGTIRKAYEENVDIVDEKTLNKILRESTVSTGFYNTIGMGLIECLTSHHDPTYMLEEYVAHFCPEIQSILERLHFGENLNKLLFTDIDLFTNLVNCLLVADMSGNIFSLDIIDALVELVKRSNKPYDETTPELYSYIMRCALFGKAITQEKIDVYDPTCGIGYLLRDVAFAAGRVHNRPFGIYGQDINENNCVMASLFNILMGEDPENIQCGNILYDDHFADRKFQYCISHMPYGLRWDADDARVLTDYRFQIGVPAKNDSQFLFIEDLISKMDPSGSRAAFITNASPLFAGAARSGENNVRKWLVDNDFIEMIIALPKVKQYVTSVPQYMWILSNKKSESRKGQIHFVDLQAYGESNNLHEDNIKEYCDIINEHYDDYEESYFNKVVNYSELKSYNLVLTQKEGKRTKKDSIDIPSSANMVEYLQSMGYDGWDVDYTQISEVYSFKFSNIFSYLKPYRSSWEIKTSVADMMETAMAAMRRFIDMRTFNPRLDNIFVDDPWYVNVPSSWKECPAMSIISLSQGTSIPSTAQTSDEVGSDSAMPILSLDYLRGRTNEPQSYAEPRNSMTLAQDGDTLLIITGANSGETIRAKYGIVGSTMARISPVDSQIDAEFLYYLISAMRNRFEGIAKANGGVPRLTRSDILSQLIYLPSLEEQKKITAYLREILGAIDDLVNSFGIKIPMMESFRESITYEAVTGKIFI